MEKDSLYVLLEAISRAGMTKKCQELIPYIDEQYLDGKSLDELKEGLGKKNRGYAEEIYKRIEQTIKIMSLRKVVPVMGLHVEDFKHRVGFVEAIFRYCVSLSPKEEKLEKKLIDAIKTGNREDDEILRSFIKRTYKEEKPIPRNGDINIAKKIGGDQRFHLFIRKNILNEKN